MIEREPATDQGTRVATLDRQHPNASAPLALLPDIARDEGIALSAAQCEQFARYRDLLLDWNARFNLTAITDPLEIERRLILDGLRLLPAVDAAIEGEPRARLVDIGSGGGFPGLVLKIARPALAVTLVDATGKKVRFLEAVIDRLGLAGALARQARAEELGREGVRGTFDLATARAVAPLPALLEYTMPLLRVGGVGLFPKGLDLAEELEAGRRAADIVGGRIESTATLAGGETRLVVARKTAPTPAAFPRRTGLPTHAPLGAQAARNSANGRRDRRRTGPMADPRQTGGAGMPGKDGS